MEKRCYGCMKMKLESPICEHCGFNENVQNLPHQLPMGTILRDQYLVGKVLGQGGFGITYLGWDLSLENPVAIKEYYPNGFVSRECTQSFSVTSGGGNADALFQHNRDRFLKEARTLAKLGRVPEIVRVHNLFTENNTAYFVMEYVQGIDLRRYINMRGGRLSVKETFTILRPVMEALSKVHEAGLVHRDISPDNIMLQPDGTAKLLDFGAVREVTDAEVEKNLSQSTEAILKHGFAPIEQYQRRGSLGPWTDVYALCATIYYCLTGQVPPDAPERVLGDSAIEWNSIPELTAQQAEALEKGMALLPKNRTGSVAELCKALFAQPAKPAEQKAPVVPEEKAIPVKQQKPEEKPYPSQTLPLEEDAVTDYMAPIAEQKPYPAYTLPLEEETPPVYTESVKSKEPVYTMPVVQPEPSSELRTKKKKPVWIVAVAAILAVVVLVGFFAVRSGNETASPEMNAPETSAPVQETTMAQEEPAASPADVPEVLERNLLMADPNLATGNANTENYPVFGSTINRGAITSVTFLDTLANAPETSWDVSYAQDNSVLAWVKNGCDLYIAGNGGVNALDCSGLFCGYINLQRVRFNGNFCTKNVKSMEAMFYDCESLTSLDISGFETANVTDMSSMFLRCVNMSSVNLEGIDTSNVTDMSCMFYDCYNLSSLDVSGWNTFNVTNMNSMFRFCDSLATLDASGWDTSNVENYFGFMDPGGTVNGQPWEELFTKSAVKNADTWKNNVLMADSSQEETEETGMEDYVFGSSIKRKDIRSITFLSSISGNYGDYWDVSAAQDDSVIAWVVWNKTTNGGYDLYIAAEGGISAPDDLSRMFAFYTNLETVNLAKNFHTEAANNMQGMFYGCKNLTSLEINEFDTSNVTDMSVMFARCSKLESLDISRFNTTNVTDMTAMFSGCNSLVSLDLSGFNTASVTEMASMFNECTDLITLDVSGWDTSNVTDMTAMFLHCEKLTSIDIGEFDTSKVEKYSWFMDKGKQFNGRPWEELFEK